MAGYLSVTDELKLTPAGVGVVGKDFVPRSEYVPPAPPAPPVQPATARKFAGYTYGDSWTGAKYGTAAWPALIREYLGLSTLSNRGVAGSRIQNIAVHLQAADGAPWTIGTPGLVVVGGLLNNQVEADDSNNRDTALESMRSIVARLSSAAIRENTDPATFVYQGDWSIFTDPMPSGGSAHTAAATLAEGEVHTATVTVTVPPGTNYLQLIGLAPEVGTGATFTLHGASGAEVARTRTDGRGRTTANQGLGEGKRAPVVMRIPGTAGGTFTLKITTPPGYSGPVIGQVDGLLTLAEAPPMVALLKPAHVPHKGYQKTDLEAYLRSIPDTMAQEFANVVVVDPNLGFDPETMIGEDLLHPVDPGHKHMAASIRDAIRETVIRRAAFLVLPGLLSTTEKATP